MEPIKGSCLCGAVRFELTGKPLSLSYCHCSRCRKQAGLSAAVLMVRRDDFRLLSGGEQIRRFTPEAPFKHVRAFCGTCGSPLGEPSETHDVFPVLHQNTSALPAWHSLPDDGVKRIDGTYGG